MLLVTQKMCKFFEINEINWRIVEQKLDLLLVFHPGNLQVSHTMIYCWLPAGFPINSLAVGAAWCELSLFQPQ